MLSNYKFENDIKIPIIVGAVAGVAATGYLLSKIIAHQRLNSARKKWNQAGKDVVVLHTFPRGKDVISLTPFSIKVETFLRMNNIRYITDFDHPMLKCKTPWISINGVEVADSLLIIEYLRNHFKIQMNQNLNMGEMAIARGFQCLLEDHFFFLMAVEKWTFGRGQSQLPHLKISGCGFVKLAYSMMLRFCARTMTRKAIMQGLGRHEIDDVRRWTAEDIGALATYLGDKPFLMGDQPSEIDCVLFGFMALIRFAPFTDTPLLERNPNLVGYVDRIKAEFFPDWDDLLKNVQ